MNRAQVLERLKLGRMIEAELPRDSEGRRGFIEVRPALNGMLAQLQPADPSVEPILRRSIPNSNAVVSYRMNWVRLLEGWESEPDDWDHYACSQDSCTVVSVVELERDLLQKFGLALEEFQVPGNTDSPL